MYGLGCRVLGYNRRCPLRSAYQKVIPNGLVLSQLLRRPPKHNLMQIKWIINARKDLLGSWADFGSELVGRTQWYWPGSVTNFLRRLNNEEHLNSSRYNTIATRYQWVLFYRIHPFIIEVICYDQIFMKLSSAPLCILLLQCFDFRVDYYRFGWLARCCMTESFEWD